jgi:CRP-like cAMP-binding protein
LDDAAFLAGAAARSKKELAAASQLKTYDAGSDVVKQGELPTEVIVIKKGSLRIYIVEPSGIRRDIRTMGPGQILGEMGVIGGHRRTASAEALEETEVWEIDRDAFAEVYSSDPQITIEIAKVMAPYILEDDEVALDVLALDLRSRVVKRLQELASSGAAVTLPRLATLSGGPQSEVVRILEQLERLGAIELGGSGIRVVDPDILRQFAVT